jgi:hypothetical protein
MPAMVVPRSSPPKTSPIFERAGATEAASLAAERSHFSDSGTKRRMSRVRMAGEAPMRKCTLPRGTVGGISQSHAAHEHHAQVGRHADCAGHLER